MKRRIMDPTECTDLKRKGSHALVETDPAPQGVPLVNAFRVTRSDPSDLVSLAKEIQQAGNFVNTIVCSKLQVIAEQIRHLQDAAGQVLMEAKLNATLHHTACNFRKVPGHVYYLYERPSGQQYFSVLSPQDWSNQGQPPHTYVGAYRLERDQSWTPEDKIDAHNAKLAFLRKIVSANESGMLTQSIGSCENDAIMDSS